jgi:hypothetical protein
MVVFTYSFVYITHGGLESSKEYILRLSISRRIIFISRSVEYNTEFPQPDGQRERERERERERKLLFTQPASQPGRPIFKRAAVTRKKALALD